MASKYDDILDSGAIQDNSIAAGSNKYAEILVEDEQRVQQSAFAASKVNPDKRAESIKLGKQVGLPTDVVERNYDDVKQKSELMAFKPDVISKKSPGLSRWLQSPDNAAVGKDDLDNLQAIEKTVQDHSLMRTLHDSFTVGLARMNATASRIPALIYNTAAIPQNMFMKAIGKPERQVRAPDWLMNNPVAEHYQKTADYGQQIPALNESIFENIKSGDYSQAAKSMAAQLAANAPNQIAIIGGMVSGYGAATLAGAGVMSAAESNKEAQDAGADPVTGVTSSLAKGAVESGFESLGTYGILKHWEGAIAKSFGKESARQVMTDFVKTISYAAAGEANEEFATSIAQDMIDYLTGVNPKAIDGIMTRAVDAGLIGAASGGAMTGPSAITAGSARAIQARQAKIDKDFYLALGDTSEVSKVRERLPEAHKELVNEVTKDGPVSTVYLPVQAMTAYFQKKNIPPAQIANELGIQKEYDEAVETGSDVAIPTSVIADKLVGTEHYKALANDIKFSPTGLTVNEAKEAEKEISDTAKEAETAVSETEKNYAASAKTVKETVKKQLIDTGMPSRDAEAQATLYESAFKSLGTRSGQDPLELFNKYGLTINGRRQDGTVLNQGKYQVETDARLPKAGVKVSGLEVINSDNISNLGSISASLRDYEILDGVRSIDMSEFDLSPPTFYSQTESDRVNALANEIKKSKTIEPLIVVYDEKGPYVLEGGHRFDALKILKKKSMPALVVIDKSIKQQSYNQPVTRPNQLGFYSKLEQTIETKMGNSQPVDALRAMLKDIKPEEMKWSGLDEFLKGKEKVSKAEVLDFIRANQLDIKEVTKGGDLDINLDSPADKGLFVEKNEVYNGTTGSYDTVYEVLNDDGERLKLFNDKEAADNYVKEQSKTKVHSIDITPELKQSVLNEGFTLFQENRGKISFGTDRKFNIELLKDANLSTFLHETGHFYLEVFGDLAEADGANQQIKDDFATLLDWFGVSSRADIKVEHHEQFARGFEAYLMDGKAPSSKLRKIFAKFKVWLTSIYRSIRDLDVQLTPEVRSVMDRLVAAEDEIKQAEAEVDTPAMFADPKAAGMSDEKAAQYIEAREEARLFAEEKIISQLMETVKRERTREYKDRRNQVNGEVTEQVDQMNVVKAQAMLQRGKMPDGSALPEGVLPIKLDKQSLIEMYGADFVKRLPRPYIYAREGGVHPDAAASILQFESGDALVQALVNTPARADLIEQMTNDRMDKIYPDMLTDGSLPQEAIDAVINEKRAQINRLELEWLQSYEPSVSKDLTRKIAQRKLPTSEQIKEQARRIIGSRAVSDIKPYLYLRAHVKYHNEAVKLFTKGDIDAAFEAKKKSVINEAIYNQALLANEDIKKSKQFFKRLAKKDEDVAKSRDVDLVNAARAILSQFGLDKTDKTAGEYLQKMADYDPERYQSIKSIVDQATRRAGPYRTVQYDDFVAMKDAVESLWSLAKSEKEIEIDGKKMDIEVAKEELIAKTIETSSKKAKAEYDKIADKNDKFKVGLLGARASLTRVETWSDVMDVKHGGPFRRYIWQPISDATLKYRQERVTVLKKYEQLLRGYEKNLTKEKIRADEFKFVFDNKAQLMMAVLHSGNDSNLHKLLVGRGWGSVNPDGTLDRSRWDKFIARMQQNKVLTKADYDFAQSAWDLLESLKPETQKAHKLMYGYYFNEVTANEIVTPFGSYRGGYMPAKVDTFANEDAAIRREREEFEKNNNSFAYPTTGRGFTKSRVESYAAPLSLDMNLLGSHIDGVLRFTYIEPRVKEVSRLVLDKRFRKALGEIDQTVAKDALIPWLQRAAQQQVVLPSTDGLSRVLDGMAGFLRANAATQIMFGNVTNTLQQMTGLVVAMTKVKPKHVRNALVRYLQSPKKNTSQIHEKSAWMKDNQDNSIYDLSNSINEVLLNPSTFEKFKDFTRKHTYFLQSAAQNIVNSVVWQGAYDQAIEQEMTDKEAVRFADSVVRTTQGTNRPEDISRFETGTKTELLFKQFVGYFNMLANLNTGELMKISRQVGLKKGAGRGFYIYLMGLAIPAIIADAIVIAMAGKGLDQDDDDEYLDDILKSLFGSQFKTITATIPYGGQFATAAYNKAFTPSKADDRVSLSPAISVLEGAVGVPIELYKRIAGDANNEKKLTKDALTLIGVMTGLPTGPVGKPVGYVMDVQSGKAEPTGPVDFTRGLVTGRSGQ